ncbi:hypothetical protein M501DRAFT_1010976 [Patellaria atrata CBS 101060]|uniref:RRM domain-containing protein n=1 Tax=Patellaria atrata CBS 101060 TaxID=1346257 RepID=A0A9P4SAS2_9PEZI|nr:hypothetical protein M501DRAFT_1010976 [Patellaria atrata CBS 101060]
MGSSGKHKKGGDESRSHQKGSKKRKHVETLEKVSPADENVNPDTTTVEATPIHKKKSKKHRKTAKSAEENPENGKESSALDGQEFGTGEVTASKAQRFIVFVGNLPYSATTESIQKHFVKLQPSAVRHRTDRTTGKSKGFAFLEFERYDRMKTCLKLYHHTNFDDGLSPARKINVELTAGGGGGKSEYRKSKLKTKNEKLNEQRKRRAQEEEKAEKKKAKTQSPKSGDSQAEVSGPDAMDKVELEDSGIHPSRRAQMLR